MKGKRRKRRRKKGGGGGEGEGGRGGSLCLSVELSCFYDGISLGSMSSWQRPGPSCVPHHTTSSPCPPSVAGRTHDDL